MSGHPRNLPHADSKAVTPISPAAKKFHLFILCSALDNSVILSNSSMPDLMLGKRHIADVNQNIAEPHAVISAPVSMKDLIITPNGSGMDRVRLRHAVLRCPTGYPLSGVKRKCNSEFTYRSILGIRKSVKFELAAAPFIIEISGTTAHAIAIVVTPD
jgi:hypothetical protein